MHVGGADESATIASCLQAGAEDFISQPVSSTVFRMKLENQLELRRTWMETAR